MPIDQAGRPTTGPRSAPPRRRRAVPLALLAALAAGPVAAQTGPAAAPAGPAAAPAKSPLFANPPILGERGASTPRLRGFAPGAAVTAPAPRRTLDLHVRKIAGTLYNPATGRNDQVSLRSYTGEGVDPSAPYVAPVIEVAPGQRVTVALHNDLEPEPDCAGGHAAPNTPHCANSTNLHSHGLWVSPAGNGDNVLVSIDPKQSFTYYYDLPDDHPSGTFWYHTHRHGSTALQVSSGMAGALVVRGNRLPQANANGDIDTLLTNGDGSSMEERLLVLQQIQYACRDATGKIKTGPDGGWVCDPGDVGGIELGPDPTNRYDQFGPQSWSTSGRFTTINGLMRPHFEARAGRVERWRLIHGGVRDTIVLAFRPRKPGAPDPVNLGKAQIAQYLARYCDGAPIAYHLVAADGLTMKAAFKTTATTLQPGYRNDALVIFPEAGDYCVTNEAVVGAASVTQSARERQLLATVAVAPGTPAPDPAAALTEALVAAAERTMPASVKPSVVADLKDGLKLTRFVPHPDIAEGEVTGRQELTFFIKIEPGKPATFEVGNTSFDPKKFDPATFAPRPYDPSVVDRLLPLGGVDEWTLQSAFASHPFHIHVNPFQIVEIRDPNGVDVSAPGAVDQAGGTDTQYPGLKGVWKDTLWVKNLIEKPADFPAKLDSSTYTIKIRTRYQRYIGEYVLHCHILDHEDQGMMQNVCVDLPNGSGTNCGRLLRPDRVSTPRPHH
ncbi:multicopper oxidase family protein [Methylobacterium sp. SyP6R]|uniref:multicopper oxidase family protein n=1 Tax=Methylobacterium sp. SyP6R TaxID=2718876 RepID=UPI001F247F70|nr:multicopper oxidase domain-containing protein [Methylobacterium sp. SyP6R]MCF4126450.1 multicopper oxidase domain-containing protein [Methylobacterium sp. SyP6R]